MPLNIDNKSSYHTLSNDNRTITVSTGGAWRCSGSRMAGKNSGKWYWEVRLDTAVAGQTVMGIAPDSINDSTNYWPGYATYSYKGFSVMSNDIRYCLSPWTHNFGSNGNGTLNYNAGDVLGFALNMDTKKLWIYKNGVLVLTGDPTTDTGPAVENITGTVHPVVGFFDSGSATIRFYSAQQTYSAPTGFLPLGDYGQPMSPPTHHWTFDNFSGYTVYNEVPGANNLTLGYLALAPGKFGICFGGTSTTETIDGGTNMPFKSISLWLKRKDINRQEIFMALSSGAYLQIESDASGSNVGGTTAFSNLFINTYDWYHVVITEGSSPNYHVIWVNSVKGSSEILTGLGGLIRYFSFEYSWGGADTPALDNIQIYDRVLTSQEIVELYNANSQFVVAPNISRGYFKPSHFSYMYASGWTLSADKATVVRNSSGWKSAMACIENLPKDVSSYFEFQIGYIANGSNWYIGVCDVIIGEGYIVGVDYGYALNWTGSKVINGTTTAYGSQLSIGDVIGVYFEPVAGKLYFSRNGTWFNSADLVAGTGFMASGITDTLFPAVSTYDAGTAFILRVYEDELAHPTSVPDGTQLGLGKRGKNFATKVFIQSNNMADGSQQIVDSSPNKSPIKLYGGIAHSTDAAKWGSSSIEFIAANSQYLYVGDTEAFNFTERDFYISFRFKRKNFGTREMLFGDVGVGGGSIVYRMEINGTTLSTYGMANYDFTIPNDLDWHHYVYQRRNGYIEIGYDGDRKYSTYSPGTIGTNGLLAFGRQGGYDGLYFDGYMDDIQVVKGKAFFDGATYTVPSERPTMQFLDYTPLHSKLAHYDASDKTKLTIAGTGISQWDDISGNTKHITQTTDSFRPSLVASGSGIAGFPSVDFNGTSDYLQIADPVNYMAPAAGFTVAMVIKTSEADNNVGFVGKEYVYGIATREVNSPYYPATMNINPAQKFVGARALINDGLTKVIIATFNPEAYGELFINGWDSAQYGYVPTLVQNNYILSVGALFGPDGGWAAGLLGELQIIPGILSPDEIQKLTGHLAWKWDADQYLPSYHPYKLFTPLESAIGYVESSLQLLYDYVYVWIQNPLNLVYNYSEFIQKELNIKYVFYICNSLIIRLSNSSIISKDLLIRYIGSQDVNSSLKLRWTYALELLSQLNIKYDVYAEIMKELNIKYKVSQGEVQNFLNFVYENKSYNLAENALKMIWHSFYADSISQTPNVSVLINNVPIPFNKVTVSNSKSRFIIIGETSTTFNTYSQIHVEDVVVVTISSDMFNLIVSDKYIRQLSNSAEEYVIEFASPGIKLLTPYSKPLNGEIGPGLSSNICIGIAASEGVTLIWSHIDKYFDSNLLYADDESKIDCIRKIVQKMGGKVLSKKDGTLVVTPKYTESISNWPNATPSRVFTNADFESISEYTSEKGNYNRVFVSSQLSSSLSQNSVIRTEEIDSHTKIVKGFATPLNSVVDTTLETSGGSWVSIDKYGLVSETIEEEIEFVSGSARTQNPIYTLLETNWLQAFLGNITFAEDGTLEAPTTGTTKGCSYARIKYVTKYYKWIVKSYNIEAVQFILNVERK